MTQLGSFIRYLSSARTAVIAFFTGGWDTDDTELLGKAEGMSDAFPRNRR